MSAGFAIRRRLRDWRTSLAFITVIGLAIALAGTWISIAYPLIGGSLPFSGAGRIVAIESFQKGERRGLSWIDMEALRGDSAASVAAFLPRTWGLQTERQGHVEVVLSLQVTGEFFRTLAVDPAIGEPLTTQHEQTGNQNFVWLSHRGWQRLLAGGSGVAGRTVWINAAPYRVAGVLPGGFDFPHQGQSPEIYIPLNRTDFWGSRGAGGLGAVARLQPGVERARFQAQLDSRAAVLASEFPATNRDLRFGAIDLAAFLLGDRLRLLYWLLLAVLVLVVVAMTNASGIWLAQWLRQQSQVSIQLALGASMRRVWAEQAAQVLLLGGVASAAGLLGASLFLRTLRSSTLFGEELAQFELWQKASLDPWMAAGLTGVALLTSLISGAIPLAALRGRALARTTRSSRKLRATLAVAQLALTGTLAYAAIQIGRNVQHLVASDRGFRTDLIFVAGIGIPEAKYDTDEKMIGFHRQAIEELKRIPGVTGAGGGVSLPVSRMNTRFLVGSEATPRDRQRTAKIGVASPGLLPLLEIPVLRGRQFAESDRWNSPKVALVNQAFADRYLAAERDPLGQRLRLSFYNGFAAKPYAEHEIVGVVRNTLNHELGAAAEPQIIISPDQMAFEGFQYFIRSNQPASALKTQVQEAIWRVDPELQRTGLTPLLDRVEQPLLKRRMIVRLLGLFGGIAVLIVVFGLASSLSATFLEMTRDLGIRSAVGASPLRLAFEAVRWAVAAVLASCLLTLPVSILLGRLMVLDRGPAGWDAASWVGASLLLGAIGAAAAFLPARRAASVDLSQTLRSG